MKILVCGGRNYGLIENEKGETVINKDEVLKLNKVLDELAIEFSTEYNPNDNWLPSDFVIISGMARGADSFALDWAVNSWVPYDKYPANWTKYGRSAGPIRNQQMIDDGKPDLIIAFPGGTGTADMIRKSKKAGIPVRVIE